MNTLIKSENIKNFKMETIGFYEDYVLQCPKCKHLIHEDKPNRICPLCWNKIIDETNLFTLLRNYLNANRKNMIPLKDFNSFMFIDCKNIMIKDEEGKIDFWFKSNIDESETKHQLKLLKLYLEE